MSHKTQMAADIDAVFFELDEYAELRTVNGKPMHVVDDSDSLHDWSDGQHTDGLYTSDRLLRIPAHEYGPRPKAQSDVTIDGAHYRVVEATDDLGVYALRLRRAKM
nr:MAG TPA: ATP-binding sugar transporter [Caudoviricetes sp.]